MRGACVRLLVFLVSSVFVLTTLPGCGTDDDGPGNPLTPVPGSHVLVHFEGDSIQVDLDDLPSEQFDGLAVVYLHRLVSEEIVPPYIRNDVSHDTRVLHSYEFVGDDGFSAHGTRGYPNNTWEQLPLGFIIKSTQRVIFPDENIDLPGAYNVRDVRRLRIWRKVDIELAAADTTVFYELRYLQDQVADVTFPQLGDELEDPTLPAIALARFIELLVDDERLEDPAAYAYRLTAVDGFGTDAPLTWEQLQTGYWLPGTMRTRFSDPDLQDGRYRLANLERITVQAPGP